MQNLHDDANPLITGHLLIRDKESGETILSKRDVEHAEKYSKKYSKKDNREE